MGLPGAMGKMELCQSINGSKNRIEQGNRESQSCRLEHYIAEAMMRES